MDPNLFRLDWDQVAEALATVVVLAFIVERALAVLFESRAFVRATGEKGVKEPIAFAVSFLVCWYWSLDVVGIILHGEKVRLIGEAITAALIAGGSKASLKLFRDVFKIESEHSKKFRLEGIKP